MGDCIINADNLNILKTNVEVKSVCFTCKYFDDTKADSYRCAVLGTCPGITLSEQVKRVLVENNE